MPYTIIPFLLAFMLSALGCAPTSSPAPMPPLAVPLSGSPEEVVFALPKWKPGATARFKGRNWGEVRKRDRVVLNPPKGLKSGSRVKQAEK